MKASELKQKSVGELEAELSALLREHFNLRMQKKSNQQSTKTHQFKIVRRSVARIKTVLNAKGKANS
ncbi:50S ribosomal subunit protein L29 [Gammaproteobacteria bacterium]